MASPNWQSFMNGSLHTMTRFASFAGGQSRSQLNHAAWLAAKSSPAAVARGNLAMLEFNEEHVLPEVQIPVLVIAGEFDRMTLRSASEHIETLLPNERSAAVDGGHLGHWERAEKVSSLLIEFADQVFTSNAETTVPSTSKNKSRPSKPQARR